MGKCQLSEFDHATKNILFTLGQQKMLWYEKKLIQNTTTMLKRNTVLVVIIFGTCGGLFWETLFGQP